MTLHEVTIATDAIMKRKKIEMRFSAACMGASFKDDEEDEKPDFNDNQEAAIKKAMSERGIKWQN